MSKKVLILALSLNLLLYTLSRHDLTKDYILSQNNSKKFKQDLRMTCLKYPYKENFLITSSQTNLAVQCMRELFTEFIIFYICCPYYLDVVVRNT